MYPNHEFMIINYILYLNIYYQIEKIYYLYILYLFYFFKRHKLTDYRYQVYIKQKNLKNECLIV